MDSFIDDEPCVDPKVESVDQDVKSAEERVQGGDRC